MDYTARLEGSSLIPFDIIGKTIVGFLLLMTLAHLLVNFFHQKDSPKKRRQTKIKIGGGILIFILSFGVGFSTYWLLPTPHILRTSPKHANNRMDQDKSIEITFDRPVSRTEMKKSISPEVPGVWVFEKPTYNTHLTRKVVFYPQETLSPDTEYMVTLSGITNTLKMSSPYTYEFSFRTHKNPVVEKVVPGNGERLPGDGEIKIYLSDSIEGSHLEFEFFPTISFSTEIDQDRKVISIVPHDQMEPSAHYLMSVYLAEKRGDLNTMEVIEEGEMVEVFKGSFQTEGVPSGVASILPVGSRIAIDDTVAMRFTKPMNKQSVEDNFSIEPKVRGGISWVDDYMLVFAPEKLEYDTKYTIRIRADALTAVGKKLGEEVLGHFTTLGEVGVEKIVPENGKYGVGVNTKIKLTLNQDVDRTTAQNNFSISPAVPGKTSWQGRTLVFTPSKELDKNTSYKISLDAGIRSIKGLPSKTGYVAGFTTTQTTFKLPVPAYLQKYSLSCEVASLRMALAFRGISVSEDELLGRLGFDPTPHTRGVWGNPNVAFVGDVKGRQMTTGYGVHWGPIAKVAKGYTQASEFSGWNLKQLLSEVAKNNPVIVWGYSGGGRKTSWNTPSGEKINTVSGEHTYLVVGFVGTVDNPSRIIVSDSLIGQIYLTRASFAKKWAAFGNSGVVVY